jgi:hypothetical protein
MLILIAFLLSVITVELGLGLINSNYPTNIDNDTDIMRPHNSDLDDIKIQNNMNNNNTVTEIQNNHKNQQITQTNKSRKNRLHYQN